MCCTAISVSGQCGGSTGKRGARQFLQAWEGCSSYDAQVCAHLGGGDAEPGQRLLQPRQLVLDARRVQVVQGDVVDGVRAHRVPLVGDALQQRLHIAVTHRTMLTGKHCT